MRAILYRTAAWQAAHAGEPERRDSYLRRCLAIVDQAGLTQQRAEVEALLGDSRTMPMPRGLHADTREGGESEEGSERAQALGRSW